MGTGYTRNDSPNNIADGNVINASDFDGEFDLLQSAFNASTGHSHDGTSGEGGPITKTGPAQEFLFGSTSLTPVTTNTVDIGSGSNQFKDLYIDGTAYLDAVDIDSGAIDGTPIGANSASTGAFTTLSATSGTINGTSIPSSVTLVSTAATQTLTNKTIDSASNTLTVDLSEATVTGTLAQFNTAVSDATLATTTTSQTLTNKTLTSPDINTPDIDGGTIDGTVIGGNTAAAGSFTSVNATGTVTANSFSGDGSSLTGIEGIPTGVIVLWSGSIASIPSGFVLCDGTNSTPNLQDRFVIGAGSTYAVDASGGATTINSVASHTHSFSGNFSSNTGNAGDHGHNASSADNANHTHNTNNNGNHSHNGNTSNIGNHTHSQTVNNATRVTPTSEGNTRTGGNGNTGGGGSHSHSFGTSNTGGHSHTAAAAGAHSHTVSVVAAAAHAHSFSGGVSGNTGSAGSATVSVLNPYYALAFIQKT